MNDLTCICLAAGRSSRMMGDHKLLKSFRGVTVIERVAMQLCELSCQDVVFIVGAEAKAISALLSRFPVRVVFNPLYAVGMHSSIRIGIEAVAPASKGALICLGDQPFQLKTRVQTLIGATPIQSDNLSRSSVGGQPGHPVLIGRDYFSKILEHSDGDFGCSYLFKEFPCLAVPQHESALWDLDTPEDFAFFEHDASKF